MAWPSGLLWADRKKMMRTVVLLMFAVSGAGCATMIPRDVVPERLADEAELAGMPNVLVWGDSSRRFELGIVIAGPGCEHG